MDSSFTSTNRRDHVFGGVYNVLDSLTLGVTTYITEPIFSPTTADGSSPYEDKTVTVLAELIWKF